MILFSHLSNQGEIELWLRQEYLSFIHLEVAGLLVIISSGLLMIFASNWVLLKQWWLRIKKLIVIICFIPLELIQLYLYRSVINKAFITGEGIHEAIWLFDRFSVISIFILTITVPAVLMLGIFKPKKGTVPD